MKTPKHLSFSSLRTAFSQILEQLPDQRQAAKTKHRLHDAVMSSFACMFFQDPSLLHFQQQLKEQHNMDNLSSIFNVDSIPQPTQLRDIVDGVDSAAFQPVFNELLDRLRTDKLLKSFEFMDDLYLCSLDATQFFSSETITCAHCLKTTHAGGVTTYSHKALQAAIMHPDRKQVIALMPEEISNDDGHTKQDCEINAAKRLLPKLGQQHPHMKFIICGDGLYSKYPFVAEAQRQDMHFILVAKPDDHCSMMNVIAASSASVHEQCRRDERGRLHRYRWISQVPLSGNSIYTPFVNFFSYQLIVYDKRGKEKITYQNSWVTDLDVTADTIELLVRAARCRWKIENECFNTLKNQGYRIEHNFGHGNNNLCFNFFILTLLAFFFHQLFELADQCYQACRVKFGSKAHLWQTLRSYIRVIFFYSFEHLLAFALTPPGFKAPPLSSLAV